jgi:hypothetical protein
VIANDEDCVYGLSCKNKKDSYICITTGKCKFFKSCNEILLKEERTNIIMFIEGVRASYKNKEIDKILKNIINEIEKRNK